MLQYETIEQALYRWRTTPDARLALEIATNFVVLDTSPSLTDEEWSAYTSMIRLLLRFIGRD